MKTLTLSNKQMTLAVFRQLPRVGGIPGDGLWGWVNYHPDEECRGLDQSEHRHVIAEYHGQLYRYFMAHPSLDAFRPYVHMNVRYAMCDYEEWDVLSRLPQLFIAV